MKPKQKIYNSALFKIPFVGRALWLISLYFVLWKSDFDVIESSWYGMMNLLPFDLYKNKLKVTTLFDAMADDKRFWKSHPDFFVVAKILQPPHLKFNDLIITSSNYSKNQIMKIKGISEDKIKVVYYGVSDDFRRINDKKTLAKIKKKLDLPDEFILNVGCVKNTKNIIGILRAFNIVAKKHPNIHLVFSGKLETGSKASDYHKKVGNELMKLSDDVRKRIKFLNYIPDEELRSVYSMARIFFMPSLEEGFGLPVIEAMKAGVPVITSNVSCMPEVAGGAALLCNPYNPHDMASKLELLLKDKDLYKNLISKGIKRASFFTWRKTAQESARIYEWAWNKKFRKKSN